LLRYRTLFSNTSLTILQSPHWRFASVSPRGREVRRGCLATRVTAQFASNAYRRWFGPSLLWGVTQAAKQPRPGFKDARASRGSEDGRKAILSPCGRDARAQRGSEGKAVCRGSGMRYGYPPKRM
jgi:hypothetical protein